MEKYFLPYFADIKLEDITHTDIVEFELWRDRQMLRKPKTSTLNNFTSAWNRVIATAVAQGYISDRVPVPKLTTGGVKGKTRPAFTEQEINTLLVFMEKWQNEGRLSVEREMRPLLRDYVEMLLLTGMRHGTEAMGIRWKDIEWHTHKGIKYLPSMITGLDNFMDSHGYPDIASMTGIASRAAVKDYGEQFRKPRMHSE
ncbi:MAG: hypothetical protein EBW39_08045, partial [Betaproteobacteria bacterium]|nr:hypothetical protein [Betaproteobacteria bacterium]